jgi:hypothetical protein
MGKEIVTAGHDPDSEERAKVGHELAPIDNTA